MKPQRNNRVSANVWMCCCWAGCLLFGYSWLQICCSCTGQPVPAWLLRSMYQDIQVWERDAPPFRHLRFANIFCCNKCCPLLLVLYVLCSQAGSDCSRTECATSDNIPWQTAAGKHASTIKCAPQLMIATAVAAASIVVGICCMQAGMTACPQTHLGVLKVSEARCEPGRSSKSARHVHSHRTRPLLPQSLL